MKTLSVCGVMTILGATAALSACTVTSSSGGLDAGIDQNDSGSTTDGGSTKDTGTTTDGGDDGGTCTPNVSFGPQACDTCMAQKCSNEVKGCYCDTDCIALNDCIEGCVVDGGVDQTCVDACGTAHPNSTAKFNATTTCLTNNCNAECP
jgi:hypothetical protein